MRVLSNKRIMFWLFMQSSKTGILITKWMKKRKIEIIRKECEKNEKIMLEFRDHIVMWMVLWWNEENNDAQKIELLCWRWKSHDGIFRENGVFYMLRKGVCIVIVSQALSTNGSKKYLYSLLSIVACRIRDMSLSWEMFVFLRKIRLSTLFFDIWTSSTFFV